MGSLVSKSAMWVVKRKDLFGRVAIVTGPTTGIGYEIALSLASVGCHVILAGRKQSRLENIAQAMTQRISKTHPGMKPQFTPIELDLTSLASIHTFATRFTALGIPCHYLFNNAGVASPHYGQTVDGFETQMGINCIGHQYLTNLLVPTLIASSTPTDPSRVINTSSTAHYGSKYHVNNGGEDECSKILHPTKKEYGAVAWYCHSKLGNVWHAREITRRYASQGVVAIAVHPGTVSTEIMQQRWYSNLIWFALGWTMKTANQGAAPEVWAALDPEWPKQVHDPNFSFYSQDCYITSASRKSRHTQFAKLWYDYNDSEIARVITQLGIPTSLSSSIPPTTSPVSST